MRPDYPSYHSSQIGFLSSSFEPRPPRATRLALLAIDLLSSSTAPRGAAVVDCLLRPAQSACRGCRLSLLDGVACAVRRTSVRISQSPSLRVEATPPPRLHRRQNQSDRFAVNGVVGTNIAILFQINEKTRMFMLGDPSLIETRHSGTDSRGPTHRFELVGNNGLTGVIALTIYLPSSSAFATDHFANSPTSAKVRCSPVGCVN
jgi:hypothetical protein